MTKKQNKKMVNNVHSKWNGKRAVIYVRYSSSNQNQESADAQIRACEDWAKQHNVTIVWIYQDLEKTGTKTDGRDDFKKMINASNDNHFELVLCHRVDRFARNQMDYLVNEKQLNDNGVEVIPVASPFDDSIGGKMHKAFLITMAESFSENLSDEVSYKMKEYARKGQFLGGVAPLGYMVGEKDGIRKLIVNPNEALIIKEIFNLYSSGIGYKKTIEHLLKNGYKTRNNKSFSASTIKGIVRNDVYIGNYTYNKNGKKDDDVILIENNHEPIIDLNTWEKTQQIIKVNRAKPRERKGKSKFLLTGFMSCGCCNKSFVGAGGNSKYRYYGCYTRIHKTPVLCDNLLLRKDFIEEKIINLLKTHFFSENNIKPYIDLVMDNVNQNNEDVNKYENLKSQKEEINESIRRLKKLYVQRQYTQEEYDEYLGEYENELNIIEKGLYEYEVSSKKITRDDVEKYLMNFQLLIEHTSDDFKEKLIKNIIDKIVVHKNKVDIYFKVFSPYPHDMGNNITDILDNIHTALPLLTLSKQNIKLFKLENGVFLGKIKINRD